MVQETKMSFQGPSTEFGSKISIDREFYKDRENNSLYGSSETRK
jgi:hypothetical protein